MVERAGPTAFVARERDGIGWLETVLEDGVVRFTLAFDSRGRPVDLGTGGDDPAEARLRVARAIGLDPARVFAVEQVHGQRIVEPDGPEGEGIASFAVPGDEAVEADGLFTREPDDSLAVQVADCLPIAVAGPGGRVLLHCGWRGLATGMLEQGVALVAGSEAVIGPSIGPCCYEVGPEVADALGAGRTDHGTIDLVGVAKARLEAAGVASVLVSGLCTSCESDRFFSYRRQGKAAGRQMAIFSGR